MEFLGIAYDNMKNGSKRQLSTNLNSNFPGYEITFRMHMYIHLRQLKKLEQAGLGPML
jgi:hypothetical protein